MARNCYYWHHDPSQVIERVRLGWNTLVQQRWRQIFVIIARIQSERYTVATIGGRYFTGISVWFDRYRDTAAGYR